ncbi:MAG: biopolymer transporter ExbD [Prevotella sp.]|jgi:biopolymer transport protein ExbD|nr:biopolymer transporter ExbD [Prevotella sp.]
MSRFRQKQNREVPGLNLAAMPDLIFTVLFFFMIVTHMRDVKPMVRFTIPQGTEVEKARQTGMVYLFIGKPVNEQGDVVSGESRIQLNDHYVSLDELGAAIDQERSLMSEDARQHMVVSIRADRETPMGLINDVKQELRKAGALSINYSATGGKVRSEK